MRTNSPMGTCRSCGKPVRWVEMVDGKRHPLDPEPSEKGRIVIAPDGKGRKLERGEHSGEAYVSHFATCPQAGEWRPGGDRRKPAGTRPAAGGRPVQPSRAPTAPEFVDAIRSTKWMITAGSDPQLTAIAMLHACTQVLIENGRTLEQVKELVERGVHA